MKDLLKQGMNLQKSLNISSKSSSKKNNQLNFIIILAIVALAIMYALLVYTHIIAIYVLFALSVVGVCICMMISKPDVTPEDRLRESTIKEFQVPNTKEALLEFTILACEKVRPVPKMAALFNLDAKKQLRINQIWKEKMETIYTRARLAMKDDPGSLAEITRLATKMGVNV